MLLLCECSKAYIVKVLALQRTFLVWPPQIFAIGWERFFSKGVEESCLYPFVKQKFKMGVADGVVSIC